MEKYHYCYHKINPPKRNIKNYKIKNYHKKSNMFKNLVHEQLKNNKSNTTKIFLNSTKSINRKLLNIKNNTNNSYNSLLKTNQILLKKKTTKKILSIKENNDIQGPFIFLIIKLIIV